MMLKFYVTHRVIVGQKRGDANKRFGGDFATQAQVKHTTSIYFDHQVNETLF